MGPPRKTQSAPLSPSLPSIALVRGANNYVGLLCSGTRLCSQENKTEAAAPESPGP